MIHKIANKTYNGHGLYRDVSIVLPDHTIRLLYKDGVTPTFSKGTATQVSNSPNVWDLTYNNNSWTFLLKNHADLLEVLGANTTGVTNMNSMFDFCYSLNAVSLFDTSSVTNMGYMFRFCTSLKTVPLFDTSNVGYMDYMFASCSSLTNVPLFNTSNVINMEHLFSSCSSLTSVPFFDTSKVTNMRWMLNGCSLITNVPLFNTSNVTNMAFMLRYCKLTNVPLFDTSKVTDMDAMLYDCLNVQSGALALYLQASTQAIPPINHSQAFYNCGINTPNGSAELAQIPTSWGGTLEE